MGIITYPQQQDPNIESMTANPFNELFLTSVSIPTNGEVTLFEFSGKGVLGNFQFVHGRTESNSTQLGINVHVDGVKKELYYRVENGNANMPAKPGSFMVSSNSSDSNFYYSAYEFTGLFRFEQSFSIRAATNLAINITVNSLLAGVYYT